MDIVIAIVLTIIAVILLVAVWQGWITNAMLQNLAAISGIIAGLAAIVFFIRDPWLKSANCLALEGGMPFIKINEPLQIPTCIDPTTPACTFKIIGTAGGVQSFNGCRIHTFVYPVIPKGIGWYIQQPPVSTASGSWTQTAILGTEGFPAETGNILTIQAALVRSDATLKGTKLSALELSTTLLDLDDIEGIVILSEPIFLTVQR